MPSCNKFFSHTAKLPHRMDLRGKSLSSCSRSCRAASRRMGLCRPKAVKGCKASLAQKRAVEKGGEHRGGTKQTFHAPRTTATTVCLLAARPGPFCRARRAVRARRTAVGLPVVVCCCHLRHCGPKQLAAFCPGPLSALFPKWRPAGALARGIAARCGPRAMPGKGWRRFLGHVAKALRPSGRGGWSWLRQPASPVLPPCCRHAAGSLVSARPARLRQCGSRFARQHNRAGGLGVGKGCLRVASGGKGRLGSKTYMEHIVVGHYELFCIE